MSKFQVISNFWPLSFTAFGGPNAHIAMFYDLFVDKLKWLSAEKFAELFSITQTLPGPGSTQMAYSIALMHGGIVAGIIQHLMWTIPGSIMMIGFAYGISNLNNNLPIFLVEILNGLTSSAVGLVALSAYKMGNTIIKEKILMGIATIVAVLAMCFKFAWLLPVLMVFGGIVSLLEFVIMKFLASRHPERLPLNQGDTNIELTVNEEEDHSEKIWHNHKLGLAMFTLFLVLLVIALVLKDQMVPRLVQIWGVMYFVGSIIFGGGTVVIPALQQYVVGDGWLSDQEFLIGLALINAMPG